MIRTMSIGVLIFGSLWAFQSSAHEELYGKWNFFGFIYNQQQMAPINPKLKIQMIFHSPKTAVLRYWRENEDGFCERHALFEILPNNVIYQRVSWVHPDNRSDCAQDPDMVFDSQSWTPIAFVNQELRLFLPLGDESLVFRFQKEKSMSNRDQLLIERAKNVRFLE